MVLQKIIIPKKNNKLACLYTDYFSIYIYLTNLDSLLEGFRLNRKNLVVEVAATAQIICNLGKCVPYASDTWAAHTPLEPFLCET